MNEDNPIPEYRGKTNAEIRRMEAAKFGRFMMLANLFPVVGLLVLIALAGVVATIFG